MNLEAEKTAILLYQNEFLSEGLNSNDGVKTFVEESNMIENIHVKERNAIFPFPESCPFFSESERKAGLIWKGRKGTGKERYDGPKFPFLSISDFPI